MPKFKSKVQRIGARQRFQVEHDSKKQDARLQPIRVSKYAKAKLPKGLRTKREPIGTPKPSD